MKDCSSSNSDTVGVKCSSPPKRSPRRLSAFFSSTPTSSSPTKRSMTRDASTRSFRKAFSKVPDLLGVSGHSMRNLSNHSSSSRRSSLNQSKSGLLGGSDHDDDSFGCDDDFCFAKTNQDPLSEMTNSRTNPEPASNATLQQEINDLSLAIESSLSHYFAASQKAFALAQARHTQGTNTAGVKVALSHYGKAHHGWVYWKTLQARLQETKRTVDRRLKKIQRKNLPATTSLDNDRKITKELAGLRETVETAKKGIPTKGPGVPKRLSSNELWNKLISSLEVFNASFSVFED